MSDKSRFENLLLPIPAPLDGSREALHSVFRRFCEANGTTPSLLISDTIGQRLLRSHGIGWDNSMRYLMNRGSEPSERWCRFLSDLAPFPGLASHTLRDLYLIPGASKITCCRARRWCPVCISLDVNSASGPYDRLLWSIPHVEVCDLHEVELATTCRHCDRSNLPILAGHESSGACPYCKYSLADEFGQRLPRGKAENDFLLWCARAFRSLVEETSKDTLDARNFPITLKLLSQRHFGGVHAYLGEALNRNKSCISTWMSCAAAPSWTALCEIGYAFSIPLTVLLTDQHEAVARSRVHSLPRSIATRRPEKRQPRPLDLEEAHRFLAQVHRGDFPSICTVEATAERLGTSARELRRVLPLEVKKLSAALKSRRAANSRLKQEAHLYTLKETVPSVVEKLLCSNLSVSRRMVHREITTAGVSIRRGDTEIIGRLTEEALDRFSVRNPVRAK